MSRPHLTIRCGVCWSGYELCEMTPHVTLTVLAAVVALSTATNSTESKSSKSSRVLNEVNRLNALSITNTEAGDASVNNNRTSQKGLEEQVNGVRVLMKRIKTNRKLPFRRKDLRLQRRIKLISDMRASANENMSKPIGSESVDDYKILSNFTRKESKENRKQEIAQKSPGHIMKLRRKRRKKYSTNLFDKLEKTVTLKTSATEKREETILKNESKLAIGRQKLKKITLGNRGRQRVMTERDQHLPEKVKSVKGGPSPPKTSQSNNKKKIWHLKKRLRAKKTGLLAGDPEDESSKILDSASYPIYSPASRPPLQLVRKKRKKYIGLKKAEPEQSNIPDENLEKEAAKGKSHLSGGNSFAVSFQHAFSPQNFGQSFGPPRPSTLQLHPSSPPSFSTYQSFPSTYTISDPSPNFINTAPILPGSNYAPSLNPVFNNFDFARPPPISHEYGTIPVKPFHPMPAPELPPSHSSRPTPGRGRFNSPPLGTPPPAFAKPSPVRPTPAFQSGTFGSYADEIQQLKSNQVQRNPAIIDAIPPSYNLAHSNLRFKNKQPMLVPKFHSDPNLRHSSYSQLRTRSPHQRLRQTNIRNTRVPRVTTHVATSKPFSSPTGPIAVSQQLHIFPGLNQLRRTPKGQFYRPITSKPLRLPFSQTVPISREPTKSPLSSFPSANGFAQQYFQSTDAPVLGITESNINDINTISEQINKFHASHEILNNFNDSHVPSNLSNTLTKLKDEVSSSLQIQSPPHLTATPEVQLQTSIPVSFSMTKFNSPITPKWTTTTSTRGTPTTPLPKDNIDLSQHGLNSLPVINTFHRLKLDKLAPPFQSIGPNKDSQESSRKFAGSHPNGSLNSVVSFADGTTNPQTIPIATQTLRPIVELKDLLLTTDKKENSILHEHLLKPFIPTFTSVPPTEFSSSIPHLAPTITEAAPVIHSVKTSSDWLSTLKTTKFPMIRPTPLRTSTPALQSTELKGLDPQFPATTYRPPTVAGQIKEENIVINQLEQLIDLLLAKENNTQLLDSLRLLSPLVSKPLPPHTPRTTNTRGKFRNLFHSSEVLGNNDQIKKFFEKGGMNIHAAKGPEVKHSLLRHFQSGKPATAPHQTTNIWTSPLRTQEDENNETRTIQSQLAMSLHNLMPQFQGTLLSSPSPSAEFFNEHFQASSLPNVPQSPHLRHQSIEDTFETSQLKDFVRIQETPLTEFTLNTLHGVQESIGNNAAAGTINPNANIPEMVLNPITNSRLNTANNVDQRIIVQEAPLSQLTLNALNGVNSNIDTNDTAGLTVPNRPVLELSANSLSNLRENLGDELTFVSGDGVILITQDEASTAIPTSLLDMIDFSKFQGRSFIFMRTNDHEYSVVFPMSEQQQQEHGRANFGPNDFELKEHASEVDDTENFSSKAFSISASALAALARDHDISLNFAESRRSTGDPTFQHHLHPPRRDKDFR
ncbi:hypothetical protein FHG87_005678 [Trinorchestia longiramus]|nr:hypothetical protein FHG87_005678 [Trinorchestia longiramus]